MLFEEEIPVLIFFAFCLQPSAFSFQLSAKLYYNH